jgi:tetratricopeptide (TPR) repeat protein
LKTFIFSLLLLGGTILSALGQNHGAKEYYQRGEIELYLGDNTQAIAQYNVAIKQHSTYAEAYFSRGRAYLRLNEWQKSAQDFQETIRLQPRKAEAYFYLGVIFEKNEELERAMESYTRAIEIQPNLPLAYNYRAELYRRQGLSALALQDYHEAIRYGGKQAPLYFGRGKCLVSLQKTQEAVADFSQAIEIEPRQKIYYQYRLEANFTLQKYQETAQDIEHLIQIQGDSIEVSYKPILVLCYMQAKDWQHALRALEALPTEYRTLPTFYAQRGDCHEALQKTENALQDFEKLLILAPDSLAYRRKCLLIHRAGKAHSLLIREADIYLQSKPEDAEVWYWKGLAHFAQKQKKEAKTAIEMAQNLGYKREDMDISVQPLVKKRKKKR